MNNNGIQQHSTTLNALVHALLVFGSSGKNTDACLPFFSPIVQKLGAV